jgi:hypothetical protein
MKARPPMVTRDPGIPTLAERVSAILRDEIADGALANIAAASQVWSAHRRDLVMPEMTHRLAAELGGLLDILLDLLAPLPRSPAASSLPPAAGWARAPQRGQQPVERVLVLRARRPVPPGGAAEIRTGLQNDGSTAVEVGFLWSDLVAEPDGRIHAGCLRLLPGQVRIPPGAFVDLAIGLDVPHDARPGVYHALLQATERVGLRALLMFPVGLDVEEASVAM